MIRLFKHGRRFFLLPAVLMLAGAALGPAQAQGAAPKPVPPAYYIAEFELKDPEAFKPYHEGVPATVAKYQGTYVVRGGTTVSLEGAAPKRIIVMTFPSLAQAQRWYHSPEYSALRPHRQRAGITRNYIVEGFLDKLPD